MSSDIQVHGDLTVYAVHELKTSLLDALNASSALRVDLSDVGEIDAAGLQLLLAANAEAHHRGQEMTLTAASQSVVALLQLTGLTTWLPSHPCTENEERP